MVNRFRQGISFILPVIVLIVIPVSIEDDFKSKNLLALLTGFLIISLGLYVMIRTISDIMNIGDGTLAPWSPTKKLVTTGLYAYVRNPMILGVITVLAGESISVLSFKIFLWLCIFFIVNNLFFVIYEEPNLEKRFGDHYREYKNKVPRWIPKLKTDK